MVVVVVVGREEGKEGRSRTTVVVELAFGKEVAKVGCQARTEAVQREDGGCWRWAGEGDLFWLQAAAALRLVSAFRREAWGWETV